MRKILLVLIACMLLVMCGCKANDTTTEPAGGTTVPGATLPEGNSDFETPIDVDDGVTNPNGTQPSTTKPQGNGGKNDPIELPMIPG